MIGGENRWRPAQQIGIFFKFVEELESTGEAARHYKARHVNLRLLNVVKRKRNVRSEKSVVQSKVVYY